MRMMVSRLSLRFDIIMVFDNYGMHVTDQCPVIQLLDRMVCGSMSGSFGRLPLRFHGNLVCDDWAMHATDQCSVVQLLDGMVCGSMSDSFGCFPLHFHGHLVCDDWPVAVCQLCIIQTFINAVQCRGVAAIRFRTLAAAAHMPLAPCACIISLLSNNSTNSLACMSRSHDSRTHVLQSNAATNGQSILSMMVVRHDTIMSPVAAPRRTTWRPWRV